MFGVSFGAITMLIACMTLIGHYLGTCISDPKYGNKMPFIASLLWVFSLIMLIFTRTYYLRI